MKYIKEDNFEDSLSPHFLRQRCIIDTSIQIKPATITIDKKSRKKYNKIFKKIGKRIVSRIKDINLEKITNYKVKE